MVSRFQSHWRSDLLAKVAHQGKNIRARDGPRKRVWGTGLGCLLAGG